MGNSNTSSKKKSKPQVIIFKDVKKKSILSVIVTSSLNKYMKFYEQLINIPENKPIDIIITTHGGSATWCIKICELIKNRTGKVRVFVKDFSHSSGSIIALAGDELYMNFSANLSAIDPQLNIKEEFLIAPIKLLSKLFKDTVKNTINELPNTIKSNYEKQNNYYIEQIKYYVNQNEEIRDKILDEMYIKPVNHEVLFFKRNLEKMGIIVRDWDGKKLPDNDT